MPITGSVGALSYARLGDNPNLDYWCLQPNNSASNNFVDFKIDSANSNVYVCATNGANIFLSGIDGFVNPILKWTTRVGPSGNIQSTSLTFNNSLYVTGTMRERYPLAFPNYYINSATITNFTTSGNVVGSIKKQYSDAVPPSGDDLSINIAQDMIFDSTGNIYLGTTDNQGPRSAQLMKYDSNLNQLAGTFWREYSYNSLLTSVSTVQLTSDEYPMIAYTYANSSSKTNVYVRKADKVVTGAPIGQLLTQWKIGFDSNANNQLFSTDLKLDSNNISYATCYNNNTKDGYLIKIDSNGSLNWQKQIIDASLTGVYVKDSSTIYTVGSTDTGNLWLAEFDDTGNIQWQNEMSGNVAFNNVKIYGSDNDLFIGGFGGGQSEWFVLKVPGDGNIPGDGNYQFNNGPILNYVTANRTNQNGSLITIVPTTDGYAGNDNTFNTTATNQYTDTTNKNICYFT